MKRQITTFLAAGICALGQHYTVPFSGGSRPGLVKIDVVNGAIQIHGYEGKDVTIEDLGRAKKETKDGLHRLDNGGAFSVSEQGNVIAIHGGVERTAQLAIQLPPGTALELRCVNCRDVLIEKVSGDIDVNTTNGGIHLVNVTGGVLAHSLNRGITAKFDQPPGTKPISLSSMNGGIDVTFPSSLKANVRLKTNNGKIFTDFDVKLAGGTVIRPDHGLSGTVNGGGGEMQLTTFNGPIYLRQLAR